MSEIKVNSIKGVAASSAAITISNTDGTCTANLTNRTNKNLVVNGAMNIAQRNLTASGSGANGYSTVDRFAMYQSGTDDYPETAQADIAAGTTPYTNGFRKSFKITNGNQSSGGQAADQLYISHKIESQDMATSGWNYTSTSSKVTLSFWVKSSVAQNFYGYLKVNDGTTQNYPFETGSLSADTWTKITKTIIGNSNLQFDTDTVTNRVSAGVEFVVGLFFGTDHTGTITLDQWGAWSSSNRLPDYGTANDDWYETNDATFEITGVQLEVSDHATSYDHKSFSQELDLCKRYYQVLVDAATKADESFGNATAYNSSTIHFVTPLRPEMRTSPTLDYVTGNNYYAAHYNNTYDAFNSWTVADNSHVRAVDMYADSGVSVTAGYSMLLRTNNSSAKISFSAEL